MPPIDPPSSRLRRDSIAVPRRENDHKPANGSFGAFLTVLVAVGFLGYVFNIAGSATSADALFSHLNASAQSENDTVVRLMTLAYPAIALFVAAMIVFGILRMLLNSLKRFFKRRKLAGRQVISLEDFKRLAGQRGIRPRIATQAYELMLPFYSNCMSARLDDRLIEDLQMTPVQVQDVYANLLRNTDRKAPVGESPALNNLMDMLDAVQNATRQSLMDSLIRPVARLSRITKSRPAHKTKRDHVHG